MDKKKLLLLAGAAVAVVAIVVGLVFGFKDAGAGKTAEKPVKIGSGGDFNRWFGQDKKLSKQEENTYYFKLTRDIKVDTQGVIGSKDIHFDLNGFSITGENNRIFAVENGQLTLKNGTVQSAGAPEDGGVLYITGSESALLLEDVTAANTQDNEVTDLVSGGVIYAMDAKVTLQGSTTVEGSPAGLRHQSDMASPYRRNGGSIALLGSASLYLYEGATVRNGTAHNAGNIHTDGQSRLYLLGGTVENGKAIHTSQVDGYGGNIVSQAKSVVYLHAGTVSGGSADYDGGNIFISNTAQLEDASGLYMFGGTVQDGNAFSDGGNIYATESHSTIRIYGGTIENGNAMMGGNLFLMSCGLELWDGTLTGLANSEKLALGGNLYISNGTAAIHGGTIAYGQASTNGGNIYISATTMDIYGGTIKNGAVASTAVTEGGGNLFATKNSTVRMYGGEIEGGIANCKEAEDVSAAGGNVMIAGSTFMEMFGGSIKNGMVYGSITRGAGVYVYGQARGNNTVFHMYGGTIENGPSKNKMRGMCIGSYSSTKDDSGFGTARVFGGQIVFTGKDNDPNKIYTLHGNKGSGRDMILYDPTNYEGMYNHTTTGPCADPTHNTRGEDVAATCNTHGCETYNCNTCGTWYVITTEPTGHTPETQVLENGITQNTCTGCGACWYQKTQKFSRDADASRENFA